MIHRFRGTLLPVICLVALTSGCGSKAENRLIGKWEGTFQVDEKKIEAAIEKKSPNKMGAAIAKGMISAMMERLKAAKMIIEFSEDGTFHSSTEGMPGQGNEQDGTWRIVRQDGNKVALEIQIEDKKEQTTLVFNGNDEFSMDMPKTPTGAPMPFELTIVFQRAK